MTIIITQTDIAWEKWVKYKLFIVVENNEDKMANNYCTIYYDFNFHCSTIRECH